MILRRNDRIPLCRGRAGVVSRELSTHGTARGGEVETEKVDIDSPGPLLGESRGELQSVEQNEWFIEELRLLQPQDGKILVVEFEGDRRQNLVRDALGQRLAREIKSTAETVFLKTVPHPIRTKDTDIADADPLGIVQVDHHSGWECIELYRVEARALADDEDFIAAQFCSDICDQVRDMVLHKNDDCWAAPGAVRRGQS